MAEKKERPLLELDKLLNGDPVRLRYVMRFSTCYVVHQESVAEHSYYVALYALMISEWCRVQGIRIDIALLLQRAICHDLEEAMTGDINRVFKHSSPELKETIDCVARNQLFVMLSNMFHDLHVQSRIGTFWSDAKLIATPEGAIIAFCDFLSVLSYMCQEVRGSNATMRVHTRTMHEYFALFHQDEFEFIRDLVKQASEILCRQLPLEK